MSLTFPSEMGFTFPSADNLFAELAEEDSLERVFNYIRPIEEKRCESVERIQVIRDLAIQTLTECYVTSFQEAERDQIASIIKELQQTYPLQQKGLYQEELYLEGDDISSIQKSEEKALLPMKNLLADQKANLIRHAKSHFLETPENALEEKRNWALYHELLVDSNTSLEKNRAAKMVFLIWKLIFKMLKDLQKDVISLAATMKMLRAEYDQILRASEGQDTSSAATRAKKCLLPITNLLTDNLPLRGAIIAYVAELHQKRPLEYDQHGWCIFERYLKAI